MKSAETFIQQGAMRIFGSDNGRASMSERGFEMRAVLFILAEDVQVCAEVVNDATA